LENFQPPLCSDFGEHSCVKSTLEHSYGAVIHTGQQVFHSRNFQPSFSSSCPQYVIGDTTGNYVFGAKISMGKKCFQLMVCCKDFQPHIEGKQALSWENFFFQDLNLHPIFHPHLFGKP
jgi:hypothetical protein